MDDFLTYSRGKINRMKESVMQDSFLTPERFGRGFYSEVERHEEPEIAPLTTPTQAPEKPREAQSFGFETKPAGKPIDVGQLGSPINFGDGGTVAPPPITEEPFVPPAQAPGYPNKPNATTSSSRPHTGTADFGTPQSPTPQGGGGGPFVPGVPPSIGQPGPTGAGNAEPWQFLPGDMRVPEKPGTPWSGDKPDFIGNTPAGMPRPTEWVVDERQTVQGQMASLLRSDNPVFQNLRESVMRAHAERGGRNSLMAARAATMMMADMAFRIGSQDAATLARSAEFNAAMANQFGLAEQRFMHNALLSDQNFRQGIMTLRESHRATLEQISAQTAGRLAEISASAAAAASLEDQRTNNQLRIMDRGHAHNLERDELGFQHNWMLNEQAQAHTLERFDRQTDNAIREAGATTLYGMMRDDNNHRNQMQLQFLTEASANGRALISSLGEIGSNPRLRGPQAAAAARDLIANFNAVQDMLRSFYASPGATGVAVGGGGSGGGQMAPIDYVNYVGSNLAASRGISMGQGGYRAYAPPTALFWGGSGTPGTMYGSNRAYAAGTSPRNVSAPPPQTGTTINTGQRGTAAPPGP